NGVYTGSGPSSNVRHTKGSGSCSANFFKSRIIIGASDWIGDDPEFLWFTVLFCCCGKFIGGSIPGKITNQVLARQPVGVWLQTVIFARGQYWKKCFQQ